MTGLRLAQVLGLAFLVAPPVIGLVALMAWLAVA